MKKIMILAVAACFIGTASKAQDVYKQTGGEKNVEVLFAPLGGSPISIGGIKFRSFTDATTALRAEVFIGFNNTSEVSTEFIGANRVELNSSTSSFDIEINPGIEFHLPGTDRLSPYYGAVLNIGLNSTTSRADDIEGTAVVEDQEVVTNGALRLGLFGVGGFDYYFAHNIYLGAEIGFGFGLRNDFDTSSEVTVGGNTTTNEFANGGSFSVGPVAQARLRLGILF